MQRISRLAASECSHGVRARGFAFLWVLIVVAVIGFGLAAVVRTIGLEDQRDREMALLSVGRQYRDAIRSYHAMSIGGRPGEYPRTIDDLLDDRRGLVPTHHLRQRFLDPMTGHDLVLFIAGGQIVGVRSSSTRAPVLTSGFKGEEEGFGAAKSYADWVFTPLTFESRISVDH